MFADRGVQQRVNYAALGVEELGSVYESLLDYRPVIENQECGLVFDLRVGSERKTTGSYYTRPELVRELIQSALVPVMEDRLKEAGKLPIGTHPDDKKAALEKAILGITVCDPACGSGHFLLEAARRLAYSLGQR
jgi:type I restriction-modification system DNA methylase subunit